MESEKEDNVIRFSGKMLMPGFSIYVMEVTIDGVFKEGAATTKLEKWFYIGMTGDNYYPSARSAFHRISGHLELGGGSTQNQLEKAIKCLLKRKGAKLNQVNVAMNTFPISGYDAGYWSKLRTKQKLSKKFMKSLIGEPGENKPEANYALFKSRQQEVADLEKKLIGHARYLVGESQLFNKGKKVAKNVDSGSDMELKEVADNVVKCLKTDG